MVLLATRKQESAVVKTFGYANTTMKLPSFALFVLTIILGITGAHCVAVANDDDNAAVDTVSILAGSTAQVKPLRIGLSCCRQTDVIPKLVLSGTIAQTDAGRHLVVAAKYFERHDYINAFIECRQALAKDAGLWQCHYMLGAVLMALLDFSAATNEFEQVLAAEPASADAHFMLAQSLRLRGMNGKARLAYREALKYKPDNALTHAFLAECNRVSGLDMSLEDECSKAISLDARLPLPYTILGQHYLAQGNFDKSVGQYEKALRIAGDDPYVHFRFGQALGSVGRWSQAEAELRKALLLDPSYADARIGLSWVLGRQRKFAEAIKIGRESILLAPADAEAHINLAEIYRQHGEPELTVSECRLARDLEPRNFRYQRALAFSLGDPSSLDEAIAEMLLISQRYPLDEDLKLSLQALVQRKKKQRLDSRLPDAETPPD